MTLKKSLLLLLLLTLAFLAGAQDQSYGDCVMKTASRWGAPCEKCESYREGYKRDYSGTYQIELKNVCNETIEVKVAVQEDNGTWRTFPVKVLAPEETMDAFACQGSGKYLYWVRRLDDTEIVLPSDQEILTEYRTF
ncbi:MAG: hypothetical protein R2810_05930 [Flavobacteriales bacterium]|nr:hypothetical protein [Flavobacteriales bacterium]MCB0786702.1 hypothetical protein [Flavobacteriales bacterium]MCB0808981.1 hypothetical protein [Flavobacteriales bacterium]MCB0812069.1 hypothetical protein [Flavobacteriales bacterium]MCB0817439.1 hypothetical protein [Flavobacteriales bacterium]